MCELCLTASGLDAVGTFCPNDMRNAYNIFFGKCKGKRSLGRPRRRWEGSIRIDVKEIGREDVNWIYLAKWRALVNTVMNLWVA
jgi:hypothetical protein